MSAAKHTSNLEHPGNLFSANNRAFPLNLSLYSVMVDLHRLFTKVAAKEDLDDYFLQLFNRNPDMIPIKDIIQVTHYDLASCISSYLTVIFTVSSTVTKGTTNQ
jgi:hypothetical protein